MSEQGLNQTGSAIGGIPFKADIQIVIFEKLTKIEQGVFGRGGLYDMMEKHKEDSATQFREIQRQNELFQQKYDLKLQEMEKEITEAKIERSNEKVRRNIAVAFLAGISTVAMNIISYLITKIS